MSRVRQATVLARKAAELAARQAGVSAEMRQARALVASAEAMTAAPGATRVLVLSPRDWAIHVQWEALLGHALRLRGAHVSFATCGGGLPVCDRVNTYEGPPVPCTTCRSYTHKALESHGFAPTALVEPTDDHAWPELDELSLAELRVVTHQGLPLGQIVEIPVRWFLCRSDLERDPLAALTYRRFLRAARSIADGIDRTFQREQPDVVLLLNGLFLFESIASHLAERHDVRVVSYERAFIDGMLFFAHGAGATRYDVSEPWEHAQDVALTAQQEARLDQYLGERQRGLRSFVNLWPEPEFRELADESRTVRRVAAFTNLTWDSAALGLDAAYDGLRHWLIDLVTELGGRTDVELVVRVHPAEVRIAGWETREPIVDLLAEAFPTLPPNVRVISPEDPLSSYSLMDSADIGAVYTSTSGLELALSGKPVLVAARPHYGGKGFTVDASSAEEHRKLLHALVDDPSAFAPSVEQARRYANLFFFEAPVAQPPASEPVGGLARLDVRSLAALGPGHAALDRICAGILDAEPFTAP